MVKWGDVCTFGFLYSAGPVGRPGDGSGGVQKAKSRKKRTESPRITKSTHGPQPMHHATAAGKKVQVKVRPWPTHSPQPMHHVTAAGRIDCLEPVFVQALSRSTICPESVHRSSRSSLCPDFVLSGVAINMMNPDPKFVQLLSGCRVSRWRMKKMRSRDCPKFVFWMEGENEVKN